MGRKTGKRANKNGDDIPSPSLRLPIAHTLILRARGHVRDIQKASRGAHGITEETVIDLLDKAMENISEVAAEMNRKGR